LLNVTQPLVENAGIHAEASPLLDEVFRETVDQEVARHFCG
jgi:hypothetical protein